VGRDRASYSNPRSCGYLWTERPTSERGGTGRNDSDPLLKGRGASRRARDLKGGREGQGRGEGKNSHQKKGTKITPSLGGKRNH